MYKIYDNVLLKDGREGAIIEDFCDGVYMIEVDEPKWDFFEIKETDIAGLVNELRK